MTRKPKHPAITEEDLLELVEGRMPLDRYQELEPALRADPDLAARVKSMARDRAVLREDSARVYSAPPGLLEGALAQAEREALVADRPGTRASAAGGLLLPKLIGGLAAGVAIALTVALTATFMLSDGPSDGERIAMGEAAPSPLPDDRTAVETDIDADEAATPAAPVTLARETMGAAATDSAFDGADEPVRVVLAADELDRAERLARDGRLRLVVTAGGGEGVALASFEGLEGLRARDGRRVVAPFAFAMYGETGGDAPVRYESDRVIYTSVLDGGTYTAEVSLDAVRGAIRGLEAEGYSVRVEQAGRARSPSLRAEDVLWWSPTAVSPPAERATIEVAVRRD